MKGVPGVMLMESKKEGPTSSFPFSASFSFPESRERLGKKGGGNSVTFLFILWTRREAHSTILLCHVVNVGTIDTSPIEGLRIDRSWINRINGFCGNRCFTLSCFFFPFVLIVVFLHILLGVLCVASPTALPLLILLCARRNPWKNLVGNDNHQGEGTINTHEKVFLWPHDVHQPFDVLKYSYHHFAFIGFPLFALMNNAIHVQVQTIWHKRYVCITQLSVYIPTSTIESWLSGWIIWGHLWANQAKNCPR